MQTIFVTTAGGTSTPVVAVAVFFFDAPVPTVIGTDLQVRPRRIPSDLW